jgi:hypothetical protein
VWLVLLSACENSTKSQDTASPADTADTADTDTDTDTVVVIDDDGDGFGVDEDCDDADAAVYPGAPEQCNGTDDDCDGEPDAGESDEDGDGERDCQACADAGFWSDMLSVTDDASLTARFSGWMPDRACTDYQDERGFLFSELDNVKGQVEGIYSGDWFSHNPKEPDWKVVNTEHVWPRSDGAQYEPVECDLHHLFPSDAQINNLRGSQPFGVVASADWTGGGSREGTDSSGVDVFEPRDARKGDVARAILYIAARYPSQTDLDAQRSSAQLQMFQDWSRADPVDEAELSRTWRIAERQGHPNPFIVCPELADRLGG